MKRHYEKLHFINFIHIKQSYRMQYIFGPLNLGGYASAPVISL
jgi:hypothetical protein